MSPDVPDKPVSFARLQQQLILTEVELMKLEDLRDGLSTRVETANRTLQDMQRITDQACAERDHLGKRTAELEAARRLAEDLLAREKAAAAELQARLIIMAGEFAEQQQAMLDLKAKLTAMGSSASWRLTAPLRALGRLFGRRA